MRILLILAFVSIVTACGDDDDKNIDASSDASTTNSDAGSEDDAG